MNPLRAIRAIALNSFREAIRSKVLATLVFFAVLLSISSVLLGQMSMHEERRLTLDISIFMSTMFSVVIAIYTMVTSLHTELERRTIYTLLSKPIYRWHFLVGKYVGVVALMGVIASGMFLLTATLLAAQQFDIPSQLLPAFFTLFLQTAIVSALALVFSSFSTPLLTGMLTTSVFVVGNLLSLAEAVEALLVPFFGAATGLIIEFLWIVIPNFEQLNLSEALTHEIPVSGSYLASALSYTVVEVAVLLIFASIVFSRRDFA